MDISKSLNFIERQAYPASCEDVLTVKKEYRGLDVTNIIAEGSSIYLLNHVVPQNPQFFSGPHLSSIVSEV